jgi:hypothetical protein
MTNQLENIVHSLSGERFKTYLRLSQNSYTEALKLYELNLVYSTELYRFLQCFEVALRNAIHEAVKKDFGEDWYINGSIELQKTHRIQIKDAQKKLIKLRKFENSIPDLISELTFGFWAHLFDGPYEVNLWRKSIRKAFKNKKGHFTREEVRRRIIPLHQIRNRIAHHERILSHRYNLLEIYNNARELLYWISPDVTAWIDDQCYFSEIYDEEGFRSND